MPGHGILEIKTNARFLHACAGPETLERKKLDIGCDRSVNVYLLSSEMSRALSEQHS